MNNIYLYKKDSKGKTRQWRAYTNYTLNADGYITITIEHGQKDGKLQEKTRIVKI